MIFTLARKTLGCLFSLLFMILFMAGGLAVAGYFLLPEYLEYRLEKKTGYRADFGDLSFNPLEGSVELTEASLENPVAYPEPEFIEINRLKIDLRPLSLLGDRYLIQELFIDIEQLGYVTNSESTNNIAGFIMALELDEEEPKSDKQEDTDEDEGIVIEEEAPQNFLIEHLVIKLDTLKVANYSGRSPRIREHDVDIMVELQDVSDPKEIASPIISELSNQGLAFIVKDVVNSLIQGDTYRGLLQWTTGTLEEGAKTIIEGVDETGQALKKVFENLKKK